MGTQTLQSLCTFVMVAGFILTGLGGLGSFYFGRVTRNDSDLKRSAKEQELISKVSSLQKSNENMRRQLELFETMPASTGVAKSAPSPAPTVVTTVVIPPSKPEAKTTGLQAMRITPVKTPAPPLVSSTEWTEAPTLEQMVAHASAAPAADKKSALNEIQKQQIAKVLRKHSGKAITIHSVAGDAGGLEFAEALRHEFLDAGWHVGNVDQIPYAKPPVGLYVSAETFPSPEEVIATYQALTAAGLTVSQQLDPKLNGEKAVLLVGATLK